MLKLWHPEKLFWMIVLGIFLLTSCTPGVTSPESTASPTPSVALPSPQVYTTSTPDVALAARSFLKAWEEEDYEAMYDLLSAESQAVISLEEFTLYYETIANEAVLDRVQTQLLADGTTGEGSGQAKYQVSMLSNLFGDIQRETQMNLVLENGQWKVIWDGSLVMPELAGGNTLRNDQGEPTRQSIYDKNGGVLAGLNEATSIGLIPAYIDPEFADGLFSLLSRVSGLRATTIAGRVENSNPGEYMPLGQVDTEEAGGVLNALAQYGAVVLTNYFARYYPNNGIAPHLVGYVSQLAKEELATYRRLGYRNDEKIGRKGIERWGEQTLTGKHGGTLYVVDPQGKLVSEIGSTPSEPGQEITTTIDPELQLGVQQALNGFRGAAVVLERNTGRVLAMASSPGFDPNAYQTENYNWSTTLGGIVTDPDLPEINRATTGLYPLGSVFKPITMAAGLESELFTADSTLDCQFLYDRVPGLPLYDWTYTRFLEDGETEPSGLLTLPQGLMRSCNPWFWNIGQTLYENGKANAVADMARAFGLGTKTGIDVVDEEAGVVPDPQNLVDAVNLAIGQGDLQATPLQVARYMAALGNGGTLFRPQAIEKISGLDGSVSFEFKPEAQGTLPLSPENLKIIQDAMRGVMISNDPRGTAYLIFNGFKIPVAGKTGSATTGAEKPHSWFGGYSFANYPEKPDIAVAVIVEDQGEGSEWAAPIWRRIVELYYYGTPQKLYPWEAAVGVTKSPTPLVTDTPTPEPTAGP